MLAVFEPWLVWIFSKQEISGVYKRSKIICLSLKVSGEAREVVAMVTKHSDSMHMLC